MVKKFMDTAAKTEKNAAKTASKWVLQKAREASGDLIGNIIIDKITLPSKTKNKEKKRRWKKWSRKSLYTTRSQKVIDVLKFCWI